MNFEYGDFVRNIYPFCKGHIFTGFDDIECVKATRENIDRFILLPSGMTEYMRNMYLGDENQDITKDTLSKYRNYRPIHDYIVECYLSDGALERIEAHFEKKLPMVMTEVDMSKLISAIIDSIDKSFDVPKRFYTYIKGLANDKCWYRLLAEAYLYSIVHHAKDYSADRNDERLSPLIVAAIDDCKSNKITTFTLGIIDKMHSDLFVIDLSFNAIPKKNSMFNEDDAYALAIALTKHQKELDEDYLNKVRRIAAYSLNQRISELSHFNENSNAAKLLRDYGMSFRTFAFEADDKSSNEFYLGNQRIRLEYESVNGKPTIKITGINK